MPVLALAVALAVPLRDPVASVQGLAVADLAAAVSLGVAREPVSAVLAVGQIAAAVVVPAVGLVAAVAAVAAKLAVGLAAEPPVAVLAVPVAGLVAGLVVELVVEPVELAAVAAVAAAAVAAVGVEAVEVEVAEGWEEG